MPADDDHRFPDANHLIGRNLRVARRENKLSSLSLSGKLNISERTLRDYESGHSRIPAALLRQIADILQRPASYFTGDPSMSDRNNGDAQNEESPTILRSELDGLISNMDLRQLRSLRDLAKLLQR